MLSLCVLFQHYPKFFSLDHSLLSQSNLKKTANMILLNYKLDCFYLLRKTLRIKVYDCFEWRSLQSPPCSTFCHVHSSLNSSSYIFLFTLSQVWQPSLNLQKALFLQLDAHFLDTVMICSFFNFVFLASNIIFSLISFLSILSIRLFLPSFLFSTISIKTLCVSMIYLTYGIQSKVNSIRVFVGCLAASNY